MKQWHFLVILGGAALVAALSFGIHSEINLSHGNNTTGLPNLAAHTPFPIPPTSPIPLKEVPDRVKAIYLTSWSAGSPARLEEAIRLIKSTELNAVVIDVKDYTGKVFFATQDPLIKQMGAEEDRLGDFLALVNRLHQEGIYVIARMVVFEDQQLIKMRPDLAVKNEQSNVWHDRQGLGWASPASKEVWDYNLAIARAATKAGVDELNFDYVRFPSDGNLSGLQVPFYDVKTETKRAVLRRFFAYLSAQLGPTKVKLSADLFGLSTVNHDDLGIGQVMEDALPYFDYLAPMVYPSHYAPGFLGYRNPAAHPYEVIHYSLENAVNRREKFFELVASSTQASVSPEIKNKISPTGKVAEIRPWLQAFDLGAPYPPPVVREEVKAVYDIGLKSGWSLWNAANVYRAAALEPKVN